LTSLILIAARKPFKSKDYKQTPLAQKMLIITARQNDLIFRSYLIFAAKGAST
jgi:hypothetical protein